MKDQPDDSDPTRRDFLRAVARYAALGGLLAGGGFLFRKSGGALTQAACPGDANCPQCPLLSTCSLAIRRAEPLVWQIDPDKCIHCGNCATYCVLQPSAVKCVHAIKELCGYCGPCFGFFDPDAPDQTTGAEGQLCPTSAIVRKHVAGPYYEYTILEDKCIACAKCVKGCTTHGNGSLFMQVRHDRCLNCSQCSIAAACPSGAFTRVPAGDPYLLKPKRKVR